MDHDNTNGYSHNAGTTDDSAGHADNVSGHPYDLPPRQPYGWTQPAVSARPEYAPSGPRPKKRRLAPLLVALCLVCTLLAGSVGGLAGYLLFQGTEITQAIDPDAETPASENPGTDGAADPSSSDVPLFPIASSENATVLTIQQIFTLGDPSTVAISTQTTTNVFGQSVSQASAGSGFILSENGYILTNYHVIDGASSIKVLLNDGSEYEASLVGGDEIADIAVLKIDATGLSAVMLGDSDKATVGDQVVAIGNPLGELANSLTVGYLSAKERQINIDQYPRTMLQTDASVSPGNSGGPLFNIYGQVIGVVSAKTVAEGVEGIGFAIPINYAMEIANELIEHGYVTGRPYLGIGIEEVTPAISRYYGLPVGLYVSSVESGSAAEKAGLLKGDVITQLDSYAIASAADMYAAKLRYKAGDTVTLTVSRSGQTMTLTLTFDEQKPQEESPSQQSSSGFGRPWQDPSPSDT